MNNKSAFSLTEVLVGVSIVSIIAFAVASLMQNQNKEMTAITEKMLINEVGNYTLKLLDNGNYCSCFLNGKKLDLTAKTWDSFPTEMPDSYTSGAPGCVPSASSFLKVGQPLYGSKVVVAQMSMQNITEVVAGSGDFSGELVIDMDQTKMVRKIKSVSNKMLFHVDPATGNFIGCGSPSAYAPSTPDSYSITVGRKSTAEYTTSPGTYKLCTLSRLAGGGDDGGGTDFCEVTFEGTAKTWTLAGARGDDPDIVCTMQCFK
jgi:prepilin-type N-terminal cleavage/methylation domain-containing protein